MVVCRICGAHTAEDDRFCSSCGARLHECPNCGFVNRVGDRFCASCGQFLEPVSPEPVLSEDGETDTAPAAPAAAVQPSGIGAAAVPWGAAAVLLAVAAFLCAFLGVGSPDRSGNIPAGAITVAGVDPSVGTPVKIDLAKPIRVEGMLPPRAQGADTVRLAFSLAGFELGSSSQPINPGPNGRFAAVFRVSDSSRYLIAGNTTGEVSLLQDATTRSEQFFPAHLENRSKLTIPLAVTLVGIYSLFWRISWLLRSLRRGRRRRSGPLRLAVLGAIGGVVLTLIAWIAAIREPTLPAAILCAVFGAAAGFSAGLSALALGDRRRWKTRVGSGNVPQTAQTDRAQEPEPAPGPK